VCKEITNFSSMYFSRANNVNAPTTWYHVVRDVPLSELPIFQWNGTNVGVTSAHYVIDKEWNYSMLYLYTNMVEVEPYFEKFGKTYWTSHVQPTLKQLDHIREHGLKGAPSLPKWFRHHVIYLFVLSLPKFYVINHVKCVMLCIPSYVVYVRSQCLQLLETTITWSGQGIRI
jgi:hypothetical protein